MKRTTRSVRDPLLLILTLAASVLGLLFVFDAGYARSLRDGKGLIPREFVMQALSLGVAALVSWWAGRKRPETWLKWSKILWAASLVALVLVEVPGIGVTMNGASRWIKFPGLPVPIQPAEFAKLTTVLYLAGVFAARKPWVERKGPFKDFGHWAREVALPKLDRALPLLWVGVAMFFIEKEPDLGTAAVVGATAGAMMFIGGVTKKSLWVCAGMCALACFLLVLKEPYRVERFTTHSTRWSSSNLDDMGFQTNQSEMAMASGGLLGVGLGAGRAKHVLPATTTDFVMATVAEETGLLGSFVVLGVMGGLVFRLLILARQTKDRFARMVLSGVGSWIGIQTCVNVMMANAFLPPIGIPVPFVSSGGSSLVALWLAIGVCQSVLAPKAVKEEAFAVSDHRWRNRRPHLSSARGRAALR